MKYIITYRKPNGQVSQRFVAPQLVKKTREGKHLLVCVEQNNLDPFGHGVYRAFRFDRILSPNPNEIAASLALSL